MKTKHVEFKKHYENWEEKFAIKNTTNCSKAKLINGFDESGFSTKPWKEHLFCSAVSTDSSLLPMHASLKPKHLSEQLPKGEFKMFFY